MININIKLFLLGATLFIFILLRIQGDDLRQPYANNGIVSMEFAYTANKATAIAEGWRADNLLQKATNNILIDFLFIPFYALLFYTLAGSISVRLKGKASTLGVLLAFFSLIAGCLDVLENLFMLLSLHLFRTNLTALLTAAFAGLKFMLLFMALLYIIIFGASILMRKKLPAAH